MQRRDLSLGIFASAAGSALLAQTAQAQTCTAPCYAVTAAETAVGLTLANINTAYPPGHVYRYGANSSPPGNMPMDGAINTAANVCRAGNYVLQLPAETCLVKATLDFSGITVRGTGMNAAPTQPPHILASSTSTPFNVISSTGLTVLEDFKVKGGWDGSSPTPANVLAAHSGNTIYFVNPNGSQECQGCTMRNVSIINSITNAVFWEFAEDGLIDNCYITNCGNAGIVITGTDGTAPAPLNKYQPCTTVSITGQTWIGGCYYAPAIVINTGVCIYVNAVMQQTQGVAINGLNNRCITFDTCYQEWIPGQGGSSGPANWVNLNPSTCDGEGLVFNNCFGLTGVLYTANWTNVAFVGGTIANPGWP